ncbi:MAG TPA: TadE/TadG family type IV pilus assembly protein [Rhizomicrobium sp.]|jgi:Flp pilus assembly protein TadG|nr:TadE/TadG family type IV pilus assembly protein [Rhizomicrobium sp.]
MSVLARMRNYIRARDGLAAVEFAFLLPVMITIFFGMVEVAAAVSCRADVSNVASTAADLVAQEGTATTADLSNVFNASNTILYPYYDGTSQDPARNTRPSITIASIVDNGASDFKSGRVAWVCAQGTASVHVGQIINFGQALMTTGGSIVYAQINYNYASPTSKVIAGTINMQNSFYTKPRRVAQIPLQACP